MNDGVLVGCDHRQEWMLPWWWSRYSEHSSYPVTFIDFGMSEKVKKWCQQRGELIPLWAPIDFVRPKHEISADLAAEWESAYGKLLWTSREGWFRKPFAMLQTPFDRTLWMDLDCEVLGSLAPLFNKVHGYSGVALAKEPSEESVYNTGVIVYRKSAPLIVKWAEECLLLNHQMLSDQSVLSHLIHEHNVEITELSSNYNWRMKCGINLNATIIHWAGDWGKLYIERYLLNSNVGQ